MRPERHRAGAWFLIRETELSSSSAASATMDLSGQKPVVHWSLATSKEDFKALGVARSHGCACGDVPGVAPLP